MMAQRENDATRRGTRPAVIIANVRSGGTFLAHCLSNHPEIFCDRGEPLHHKSIWMQLTTDRPRLLSVLTNQPGYSVSMVKLTYWQAFKGDIAGWIDAHDPMILWLARANYIRQAVSLILNRWARRGKIKRPQHTFSPVKVASVSIPPDTILYWARRLQHLDRDARNRLKRRSRMLPLTYAEIVGNEMAEAKHLAVQAGKRICEFLEVGPFLAMTCDLKRINPAPLRQTLTNWDEVQRAVARSEYRSCLADA